ncbi:hypothetical protein [Alcaligenes phenolicus]
MGQVIQYRLFDVAACSVFLRLPNKEDDQFPKGLQTLWLAVFQPSRIPENPKRGYFSKKTMIFW